MKTFWLWCGRMAYRLAWPLIRLFPWLISSPRVRVVLRGPQGEILLVRTWFGRQYWSFPGGGIARHESPERAAIREVKEETGLTLALEDLISLGRVTSDEGVKGDFVIYEAHVTSVSLPRISTFRRLEITDRGWWSEDGILAEQSPLVHWYLSSSRDSI